jgi:hypothetical protein
VTGGTDYCSYPGTGCPEGEDSYGSCCYVISCPLLIDVGGTGFRLTNVSNGVLFAIGSTAFKYQVSWTYPDSENEWLVLDRDGNGTIDGGFELFGNNTSQPDIGRSKNGFLALAEFDRTATGGNEDGVIDERDDIYSQLRVWQDKNHNGVSEPDELFTLRSAGVLGIELAYREERRKDVYGNRFRYRARVFTNRGPDTPGRWVYDVFLKTAR